MDTFKRDVEFSKLSKGFSTMMLMLQNIESNIVSSNEDKLSDFYEDVLTAGYIYRKVIISRIKKIGLNVNTPIHLHSLGTSSTTLLSIFESTLFRLHEIAERVDAIEELDEILDMGPLYFEVENAIPVNIRNLIE